MNNNRIIKFRAWDEQSQTFEYFDFLMTKDVTRFGQGKWLIDCLQQFTGLKDKNGKEIYEGDYLMGSIESKVVQGEVKFIKGAFTINDRWLIHLDNISITGNIWENPELLK